MCPGAPTRAGRLGAAPLADAGKGTLVWKKAYPAPGGGSYGKGPRATPCIDDNFEENDEDTLSHKRDPNRLHQRSI